MNDRVRALYVCYLSLSDPLVETQVVSYIEGLAQAGHAIHLLTFESPRPSRSEKEALRAGLASRGISWHCLRYHKRPSLPATIADTLAGAAFSVWLLRRHRLSVFHSRAHIPAAMSLLAGLISPHKLLFDVRGLMAEEYVDAGRWEHGGIPWRITKWVERRALAKADACVVLTPLAEEMLPEIDRMPPITVIPCCADLSRFAVDEGQGEKVRAALGFDADDVVLVYAGKFGGWYLHSEMVKFFGVARDVIPRLKFLVLTQDDPRLIEEEFERHAIPPDSYRVTSVPPGEMGDALSAADFAISLIAPMPSKRASSPTKLGEYLAAGLPVVVTAGVGAMDEKISEAEVGILVDDDVRDYVGAAREAKALIADAGVRERCVRLAEQELSLDDVGIPRYRQVYDELAAAHERSVTRD